jgi:hypothetical protein
MRLHLDRTLLAFCAALACLATACVLEQPGVASRHRWWSGLGPVLPHDSFPSDCKLCHEGESWNSLSEDFDYDHEAETGVALEGAHQEARCLRCHNDRGPVSVFMKQGCAGCHSDVHLGRLGAGCSECHQQSTWQAVGQRERHNRTRFPLVGVHASTACFRCHIGFEAGLFTPTDPSCISCHVSDLQRTTNHIGLGWTSNCQSCHLPTSWNVAEIRPGG